MSGAPRTHESSKWIRSGEGGIYGFLRAWEEKDFARLLGVFARGRRCLELGCGGGGMTAVIFAGEPSELVASDPEQGMVSLASSNVPGALFEVASAKEMLSRRTKPGFDMLAAAGSLEFVEKDVFLSHASIMPEGSLLAVLVPSPPFSLPYYSWHASRGSLVSSWGVREFEDAVSNLGYTTKAKARVGPLNTGIVSERTGRAGRRT